MAIQPGQKVYTLDGKRIIVDPEFKALLGPLSPSELGALEANLIADGRALEPLIIWAEESILLNGHNRIEICDARDIPYKVLRMNFPDREAAMKWMIENQLGRRNLSDEGKKKLKEWREQRVAAAKAAGESNRSIAAREGVSETTIRKDAEKTGATYTAPATSKGRDGKARPSRAERVGQKAPTPFQVKGEREPGDDTEHIRQAKKDAKSDTKNGATFGWKDFNKDFAKLILHVDKLGKIYKANNDIDATRLRKLQVDWKAQFKAWYKRISKQPAPDEPHEKLAAKTKARKAGKGKK